MIDALIDALQAAIHHSASGFVASLLVALACALIGVHVVARRLVAAGVALPQMAALGIACSFLMTGADPHANPLQHDSMALVMEMVGVGVLAWGARARVLGHDTLAGVLFVGAGALTILLMQQSTQGLDEIKHLVEGDILAVGPADLYRLSAALVPVALLQCLGGRRMIFCSFDGETAATLGIRTGLWDLAFYASLAVTIAAGVHATGTLFVFGFIVLPGAAGILLGRSSAGVALTAVVVALLGAGLGFVLSYTELDLPTGPACVAVELVLFLLCAAGARLRGVLAAK